MRNISQLNTHPIRLRTLIGMLINTAGFALALQQLVH